MRLIHPYIHVSRDIFPFFFTFSCLSVYFILFLYLSSHNLSLIFWAPLRWVNFAFFSSWTVALPRSMAARSWSNRVSGFVVALGSADRLFGLG